MKLLNFNHKELVTQLFRSYIIQLIIIYHTKFRIKCTLTLDVIIKVVNIIGLNIYYIGTYNGIL